MHIARDTLDDVLLELYPHLLDAPAIVGARRGANRELLGVLVEIRMPRARLSRTETRGKPFSSLGELLWYLSKQNALDFIKPFVPRYEDESVDGKTVHGGYGPRLFAQRGNDQVANILRLLRNRPDSRRAVVQIFDAEDLSIERPEVPCTTTLQFLVRSDRLDLIVTMRSNDAYLGLPHDVFCFTMLQEIIARSLGRDVGTYRHFVGSMHLYDQYTTGAQRLIQEGYQQRIQMPPMPVGDPWPAIERLLSSLERIRASDPLVPADFADDPYWCDLIRLLQIFAATGDREAIIKLRNEMSSDSYKAYIDTRIDMPARHDRFAK